MFCRGPGLQPGTKKKSAYGNDGCEGIARCGSNRTPCAPLPPAPAPPPSKFTDFPAECGSGDCSMNGTGPSKNTFHNNTQFDCGEG